MKTLDRLSYFLLIFIMVSCIPQEPVRIVITPTAQTVAVEATFTETVTATVEATTLPTRTPISGTGRVIGSVLGVIVPSATPYSPTETATLEATAIVSPTPTAIPLPTETPEPTVVSVNSPMLNRNEMGIQLYYNMGSAEFDQVLWQTSQLEVDWVKFQVDWSFFQPNSPDEDSDMMKAFVLYAQGAKNSGRKVLLSVAKAPQWARGGDKSLSAPPDDPEALARFLKRLLEQIKPNNIDAIEIWNEPNLLREWAGTLPFSGSGYMQLFRPAYRAIKEMSPSIHVVTAGLAPTGNSTQSVDDRVFLQQMYDAGLSEFQDVSVGVHPYGWGNPPDALCCDMSDARGWDDNPHFFFLETLNATRAIMEQNGHGGAQMWVTEFGWATWQGFPNEAPEAWMAYNSIEQQAEYALRAFQIGEERIDVGVMILWNLNFANPLLIESRGEQAGYSILVPNYGADKDVNPLFVRPLYRALENRP